MTEPTLSYETKATGFPRLLLVDALGGRLVIDCANAASAKRLVNKLRKSLANVNTEMLKARAAGRIAELADYKYAELLNIIVERAGLQVVVADRRHPGVRDPITRIVKL